MNHTASLRHELCSELGKTLCDRAFNNSLQSRVIICLWLDFFVFVNQLFAMLLLGRVPYYDSDLVFFGTGSDKYYLHE